MFKIDLSNPEKSSEVIKRMKWANVAFNIPFVISLVYFLSFGFVTLLIYKPPELYLINFTNILFVSIVVIMFYMMNTVIGTAFNWGSVNASRSIRPNLCGKLLKYKEYSPEIANYVEYAINSGRAIIEYEFNVIKGVVEGGLAEQRIKGLYVSSKQSADVPTREQYLLAERKEVVDGAKALFLFLVSIPTFFYLLDFFFKNDWLEIVTNYSIPASLVLFVFLATVMLKSYSAKYLFAPVTSENIAVVDYVMAKDADKFKSYVEGVTFQGRELYVQELMSLKVRFELERYRLEDERDAINCKKLHGAV